jgi:hypothetical protein
MQKKTIKASILIWSIFLSLIISITFISISTKINKNIKNNHDLKNQINTWNEIKNLLKSGSISWNHTNQTLESWEEIRFESITPLKSHLKKDQTTYIQFSELSNITINLWYSWAIFYNTIGTLSSSWVIDNTQSINNFSWTLELTNLWWYIDFEVSANTDFLPEYSRYKIIRKIGNKEVIKQQWEIKNF